MYDQRCDKLAELVVEHSLEIKPGQSVLISGNTEAKPLMLALQKKILQAGGSAFFNLFFPEMEEQKYRYSSDEVLATPSPIDAYAMGISDAFILIQSDQNTSSNQGTELSRMSMGMRGLMPIRNVMIQRASEGKLKWVAVFFPTAAYAQQAGMASLDFENYVFNACMPDENDPVGYWRNIEKMQSLMIEKLKGADNVHIIAEETDLSFSIKDRKFVNGCCKSNIPDGEIFTGPIENSVNGKIFFPGVTCYRGTEVSGVRLWFENGVVVKATAEKNQEFLLTMLASDPVAKTVGEFAFGTNYGINKMVGQILLDEKLGGTIHLALGNGYPETGSKNKSLLHWDFVLDLRRGGHVSIDGKMILANGTYCI